MLVNLSEDPKARVKVERRFKEALRINHTGFKRDKDERAIIKYLTKVSCFKRFFVPYAPMPFEYTANNPDEVFTGIYIVPGHNFYEDSVNLYTRQRAQSRYSDEMYESGDIWLSYGLCDNASQVIKYYREMKAGGRFRGNHIIVLKWMGKGTGWRWHKWGRYIGNFEPSREYFDDEEGIEGVWSFKIIRILR